MALKIVFKTGLLSVAAVSTTVYIDPIVVGQTFIAGSTDPTDGSTGWALTSHGISEKLFTVDSKGAIVPQVAQSVKKVDEFTWEVTLKSGYKFSDGTVVTGKIVSDALTELNTKNKNAKATLGKMTVTPLSDLKLKIKSERATPVMDAVLAEWPFTVFHKDGSKFIFTGPFEVGKFTKGSQIELTPNKNYARAADRPLVVIKKFASGDALATDLENKKLDLAFHLPVASLPKLRQVNDVTIKSFLVEYHYMMIYNTKNHRLSDLKVRKAIDMAIDRQALKQELKGGKGTRSFFPENTPYYQKDVQPLHGDKSGAEKLLDEAGWVKDAQGVRKKGGVALSLKIVAYPQRPGLVTMLPVIKQQLAALGITVTTKTTDGSSWTELDKIMADRDYDLLLWAQNTLPAGDSQWFLNAFFRTGGGSNHAGLSSTAVDSALDKLSNAAEGAGRISATAEAHKAVLAEVSVSNLVTPEWHVGVSSRMKKYVPWGSDYYVVHADLGLTPKATTTSQAPKKEQQTTSNSNHVMIHWFALIGVLCLVSVP